MTCGSAPTGATRNGLGANKMGAKFGCQAMCHWLGSKPDNVLLMHPRRCLISRSQPEGVVLKMTRLNFVTLKSGAKMALGYHDGMVFDN